MRRASCFGILVASLLGCGDSEECVPSEPTDDGKYHPAANGERTDEMTACNSLVDAWGERQLELQCAGTSRTCPAFLVQKFGAGKEYDQGSVQGCIAYYNERSACPDLLQALDHCVVTFYPTPEPEAGDCG